MNTDEGLPPAHQEYETDGNKIAATLVAAGIGCAVLGTLTTLSEAIKPLATVLNFYKPVGPLSGKSVLSVALWLAAWFALDRSVQGKRINLNRWLICSIICVGIGVVGTFPLFFDLFADR